MSVEDNRKRWLALAVIVAAQFMVVLDVAIVNVALPSIKTDLHFREASLQWVITAYAIIFGGVLLLGGRLADLLGQPPALRRRPRPLHGRLAPRRPRLVRRLADRVSRAAGPRRRALSPAALSILTTTFSEGRERNLALGIWGAASGSGGAAGVLLGGALTSAFSWSWIFFVNIPVGVLVLAVTPFLAAREPRGPRPPPLRRRGRGLDHRRADAARLRDDPRGAARLGHGGDGRAARGAVALVVAFVVIELRSKAPLLPLRIFRLRTLTASNVSGLLLAGAMFSQFFLLTLYMQQVLHYSALKTGVAYIALTLTIIAFSGVAQALVTRFGVRPRAAARAACSSAGALVLYAQLPVNGHYFWDLLPGVPPQRARARARVRADVDRRADRRAAVRRRRGVGADQHEPADRRRDRRRRGDDDRDDVHVATTSTRIRERPRSSGAALTHGFEVTFYVLAASRRPARCSRRS